MTKRVNLLKFLQQNPGWHTSKELAIDVGVSVRTIKTYINQLRKDKIKIESSEKGYKIVSNNNEGAFFSGNNDYSNNIPTTSKERINYIINYLINEKSEVNIYDLANQLFVSESRLLQDMQNVQRKVGRFGLSLNRKGDNWSLIGSERQKRSLLSSLIYAETSGSFLNQSVIQLNFKNIDVDKIRKTTVDICNENNVYLNTFDLNNFLLHLVIIIERVRRGNLIKSDQITNVNLGNSTICKIVVDIEKRLNLEFEDADTNELILILETAVNGIAEESSFSEETELLVNDIINYVKKIYDINLNNDSFKDRFAIHLDRLITRSRANRITHNPIAADIKVSSPTIYECAVLIAHRISEQANVNLEDNEIAYIALHVGNAIAEQMEENKKISVVILMPRYYDNAAIISNKLQEKFSSSINITKIITDPSQINTLKDHINLIVGININIEIPNISMVHLSQFMLSDDIKKMTVAVTVKQHQIKKEQFQEKLLQFFKPDNFAVTEKIDNIDQAFSFISEKLVKEEIVDNGYKNKLYQRENMSSTAFGRVAIPHSFEMSAHQSRGFIIINPKGIKWSNNKKVYLVICLAIDPKNSQLFRDVFDELSGIVTDVNNVTKLIRSSNYQDFLVKLVDLL